MQENKCKVLEIIPYDLDKNCYEIIAFVCLWMLSSVVATLTWSSVGVKPNTWKSGDLESSGTPECLKLDSKGQNTSHWGVLGVIGKVLKRRYLKWPRIGHFGHLQPKLWAKERPGVKLAV